ncbi:hypothetical protein HK105_206069 [Polyrhizophydium stewartii]|uniref:Uncharacterized protein n=1 Tax=Polyrhizophydium stewartii TaxID=2732419 RepID=A0ABR4N4P9_9FUNG
MRLRTRNVRPVVERDPAFTDSTTDSSDGEHDASPRTLDFDELRMNWSPAKAAAVLSAMTPEMLERLERIELDNTRAQQLARRVELDKWRARREHEKLRAKRKSAGFLKPFVVPQRLPDPERLVSVLDATTSPKPSSRLPRNLTRSTSSGSLSKIAFPSTKSVIPDAAVAAAAVPVSTIFTGPQPRAVAFPSLADRKSTPTICLTASAAPAVPAKPTISRIAQPSSRIAQPLTKPLSAAPSGIPVSPQSLRSAAASAASGKSPVHARSASTSQPERAASPRLMRASASMTDISPAPATVAPAAEDAPARRHSTGLMPPSPSRLAVRTPTRIPPASPQRSGSLALPQRTASVSAAAAAPTAASAVSPQRANSFNSSPRWLYNPQQSPARQQSSPSRQSSIPSRQSSTPSRHSGYYSTDRSDQSDSDNFELGSPVMSPSRSFRRFGSIDEMSEIGSFAPARSAVRPIAGKSADEPAEKPRSFDLPEPAAYTPEAVQIMNRLQMSPKRTMSPLPAAQTPETPTTPRVRVDTKRWSAEIATAVQQLKQTGIFAPFGKSTFRLRVVDARGYQVSEEKVKLPTVALFTMRNALMAAEEGNIELCRAILDIIAKTKCDPARPTKVFHGSASSRLMRTTPSLTARFWTMWANLEESWESRARVLEIFDRGDDAIKSPSERDALRAELHVYILRSSERMSTMANKYRAIDKAFADIDAVPVPTITSLGNSAGSPTRPSSPLRGMRHDNSSGSPTTPTTPRQLKKHVSFGLVAAKTTLGDFDSTPRARHMMQANAVASGVPAASDELLDLVGLLDGLSVASARKQAHVAPKHEDRRAHDRTEPRGSVTLLTPVRANRKEREELGVDRVITSVRRSARNFKSVNQFPRRDNRSAFCDTSSDDQDDDDHVPAFGVSGSISSSSCSSLASLSDSSVSGSRPKTPSKSVAQPQASAAKLMDQFGYAYVPNKALQAQQQQTWSAATPSFARMR